MLKVDQFSSFLFGHFLEQSSKENFPERFCLFKKKNFPQFIFKIEFFFLVSFRFYRENLGATKKMTFWRRNTLRIKQTNHSGVKQENLLIIIRNRRKRENIFAILNAKQYGNVFCFGNWNWKQNKKFISILFSNKKKIESKKVTQKKEKDWSHFFPWFPAVYEKIIHWNISDCYCCCTTLTIA